MKIVKYERRHRDEYESKAINYKNVKPVQLKVSETAGVACKGGKPNVKLGQSRRRDAESVKM